MVHDPVVRSPFHLAWVTHVSPFQPAAIRSKIDVELQKVTYEFNALSTFQSLLFNIYINEITVSHLMQVTDFYTLEKAFV